MTTAELTKWIKDQAREMGFDGCGISRAQRLNEEALRLEQWLALGRHGQMNYMADRGEMRTDPRMVMPEAESVISVLYNYYPSVKIMNPDTYAISKYAYGRDYHDVIREKLYALVDTIKQKIPDLQSRVCVDSAPILEKAWAARSGLGWIGKNSLLLTKKGSYFFLGEILVDQVLEYDEPMADLCGKCRQCIKACPTGAIVGPWELDATRCISYLTIELKDESIPDNLAGKYTDWIYGCDICQDACPYNRKATPHTEKAFEPRPALLEMTKDDWHNLTEEKYAALFKKSAVKRAKYAGLKRNIEFHKKQNG
jgi:epoxyqueuosine reductase